MVRAFAVMDAKEISGILFFAILALYGACRELLPIFSNEFLFSFIALELLAICWLNRSGPAEVERPAASPLNTPPPAGPQIPVCVICRTAERDTILQPCGHICLCNVCFCRLCSAHPADPPGPICRELVVYALLAFF